MSFTCHQLLQAHQFLWQEATIHPFLAQCQTAEILPQQFNTWLVQDYLFVVEFTRMAAQLLSVAPPHHFDVLLGGLTAIKDELNWFKVKAAERQLDLSSAKQPTCVEYCHFMANLASFPYAVQATAFWAIELAYNQGWQQPGTMTAPYNEFADRWGNPGFTEYVKLLEHQADEALGLASSDVQTQAEEAFIKVARLEKDFWQMAYSAV